MPAKRSKPVFARTFFAMLSLLLAGGYDPTASAATRADGAGLAAEPPFLGGFLKETHVVYPLRIGFWEAQGEHLYETSDLGASVRYQHSRFKDRWLDAYFYPAGLVVDSLFGQVVAETVGEISNHATSKGDGKAFEADAIATFPLKAGEAEDPLAGYRVKARSFSLRYGLDGQRYHSAMAMTVHEMYFVKIRYSVEAEAVDRGAVREETERFLADLVGAVRINSTGDCWRQVRTIERVDGMAKPDDLLGSVELQQGDEMWVAADRTYLSAAVLAAPARRVAAQSLANTIQDTFRGRCVAPEDINADVPEGMREIRLEFHAAPDEGGKHPSMPLRQRSTGVS